MTADRPPLAAVVLAAGEGKRMRSEVVKVLHPLAGRPMIRHVLDAVKGVGAERVVVVIGHQRERVREALAHVEGIGFAVQADQLGTGHALLCAADELGEFDGDVLVCCGDTPLLTAATLRRFVDAHREPGSPATLLATVLDDPTGYGRVIADDEGRIDRIVEEVDADAGTRSVRTVNAGVYCFRWPAVRPLLDRLGPENAQGERYLTDVLGLLAREGRPGRVLRSDDPLEVRGINDRIQLAEAEAVIRDRVRRELMSNGVTFLAPETTLVDVDATIGPDTVVYPGVLVEGMTSIGRGSVIGPFCRIVDADIGRGVELRGWNHVVRTTVPNGAILDPYVQQGAN